MSVKIRNKTPGPVQLVVRSFSDRREHAKAMTVKNIYGHKTIFLKDEQVVSEYLDKNIKWGLLTAEYFDENIEANDKEI